MRKYQHCLRCFCLLLVYFTSEGLCQQTDESPTPPQETKWYDVWHADFSDSMNDTARELDEFFALDGTDEHKNARAEGRIRIGWEPRTGNYNETDLRFRIRVKLPALKDRVDLLVADDDEYDQDNTIKAARNVDARETDSATLALRFRESLESKVSYRIGTGRRGQIFAKASFDDRVNFTPSLSLFYDAEMYYYNRDRFGSELGLRFQKAISTNQYVRFNNRYYFRDETDDWLWRHELQYLRPLTDNSATIYSFFTEGLNKPNYRVNEVYASLRWRTNPTRDWLYYEIEPFVVWLREESFNTSFGIAFRIEAYYGQ